MYTGSLWLLYIQLFSMVASACCSTCCRRLLGHVKMEVYNVSIWNQRKITLLARSYKPLPRHCCVFRHDSVVPLPLDLWACDHVRKHVLNFVKMSAEQTMNHAALSCSMLEVLVARAEVKW
ncbi:hypothetical protein TTRE_0000156701 [Trichuris trichiura]|uniref:Secreted protein n=1 Tax=Trichuris trichiura TaxID=36087 RepID=A0A077Z0R4_TRITR|nr:hypothetical protein TTRE_0000156701 [Trichuris trichiura]